MVRHIRILVAACLAAWGCDGRSPGEHRPDPPDAGPPPLCGNGTLEADEECDDGPDNSDAVPDACRTDCLPARCGDEVADSREDCDGPDLKDTTCADLGFVRGTLACNADCQFNTDGCTTCGNDICEPGETFETCPADCQLPTVHAGLVHTCALLPDGSVRCWGGNDSSQLGDGQQHQTCGLTDCSLSPVPASNLTDAVSLSVSSAHNCAALGNGTVWCWGRNWDGRLGSTTISFSEVPVAVTDLSDATAVSSGGRFSCALLSDLTARCWGGNEFGWLGDGTCEGSDVPVAVSGLSDAVALSAGAFHTCALIADGTVQCWGSDTSGQLGDGQGAISAVPVAVVGMDSAVDISAGYQHTCAVLADSTVACWGDNSKTQLGNNDYLTTQDTPVPVMGVTGAVAVSAGGAHSCALLSNTRVMCWGSDRYGQVGNGHSNWWMDGQPPVLVSDLEDVISISAGGSHTCAVLADGTVKCWGNNVRGQLGDGTTETSTTPVDVVGL